MSSKSAASDKDISSAVSKLSLQPANTHRKVKAKKEEIAESWEDESSDTETETDTKWRGAKPSEGDPRGTSAPPPTPVSSHHDRDEYDQGPPTGSSYHPASSDVPSSSARPEKTDAVARRMIAGALGLKAPKLTGEQKAYQAAIKEKERKRREDQKAAEKEREEEAAKARAAMWED